MNNFLNFMQKNPHYGYLIGVLGFGIYLIGLVFNWKWTLEPGGGYFNVAYWIESIGEKTVRIILGIVMTIGMLSCLAIFLYYNNNPSK